jgi:hypothetical protein
MTDQKKPNLGNTITTWDGTQIYYTDWARTPSLKTWGIHQRGA